MMSELLLLTICLPLAGALAMGLLARLGRDAVRWGALGFAVATLIAAAVVVANYPVDGNGGADYAATSYAWLTPASGSILEIHFRVGLDGLSVWLFALSALLMITAVLISWEAIEERAAFFYALLLLLECGCLGVFAAGDIILFYVFFEFTLIPLFFLIGIWGSEERRYAAYKFFVFTLAGSLLTLLGLVAIVICAYRNTGQVTFSIAELTRLVTESPIEPVALQVVIFLALFSGFAIKVPMFPLHTWLPLAHVQAPAAGSVFLAGVLLKIGVYGFARFSLPLLPAATAICMPWMLWLAVLGILYGAMVALAQGDMKRLIAYSSVSHMGYCMLGLFALNPLGVQGAALQMINHGLSTGALFALVGMIYERYHTRAIRQLGGIARKLPWLAFFMVLFTFSSIAVPGLNGFAGEFLILLGMFQRAWAGTPLIAPEQLRLISILAMGGVVLGAWYMLWLVQRVFFGPLREPEDASSHAVHDLSRREILALAPLAVFVVWIGIQPGFFLARMGGTLNPMTAAAQSALENTYPSRELAAGPKTIVSQPSASSVARQGADRSW